MRVVIRFKWSFLKKHHEDLFLEEVLVINQKVFDQVSLDIK